VNPGVVWSERLGAAQIGFSLRGVAGQELGDAKIEQEIGGVGRRLGGALNFPRRNSATPRSSRASGESSGASNAEESGAAEAAGATAAPGRLVASTSWKEEAARLGSLPRR
jgi:hypothetical protein